MNASPPSRREFLKTTSSGFGYLAFAALAHQQALRAATGAGPLAPKTPHFSARAKRVIFLCMQGGPSHVDMLDYKPKLAEMEGRSAPASAGRNAGSQLLGSRFKFSQHGRSGLWISELLPQLAKHADDLCLLNSMTTDLPAHPQAFTQLHTGSTQFVRPSMGAWTLYGLGSGNENLPGFITINPPPNGARTYGSAFLPAIYQGTRINGGGSGRFAALQGRYGNAGGEATVANIKNPRMDTAAQRTQMDLIQTLNKQMLLTDAGNQAEVEGAIESFELAYRMQAEVPKVMDLANESEATKSLYGIGENETDAFGKQCLMARKFVEAGVRFVEITHGNWDHHRNLTGDLERNCGQIDKPIAGLLADLKQRGLLKDTLVIWGGEFGRTPHSQGSDGRDHNNKGFTMWMAGGGVKGGMAYGATDELGYEAVDKKMHVHDWHATVLHLLGLDHERLTFRYAGRDFRLTDVYGNVAREILG
jgi:hypothetical protein